MEVSLFPGRPYQGWVPEEEAILRMSHTPAADGELPKRLDAWESPAAVADRHLPRIPGFQGKRKLRNIAGSQPSKNTPPVNSGVFLNLTRAFRIFRHGKSVWFPVSPSQGRCDRAAKEIRDEYTCGGDFFGLV